MTHQYHLARTPLAALAVAALVAVRPAADAAPFSVPTGSWAGSYALGGTDSIAIDVHGRTALVALGPGHAGQQAVPLRARAGRISFRLPGRPQPLVFDAALRRGRLVGTVQQGAVRGTLDLGRGTAPVLAARGLWATSSGVDAVVDDPYGPPRLVELDSGRVRALATAGTTFSIGSGFAETAPATGAARFGPHSAVIDGRAATRLAVRQLEVRFRSGSATLAGTLSLPAGGGRHAAVAFVQGSGATPRAYLPELAAALLRHGVAVLAYDKRGIGQSGGAYPGESPTDVAVDLLARDATAAARFLAAQPEVDPRRVGLAGHSQAGWIAPLAASREQAIRFLVLFSAPTVTAGESDLYQDLTGQGEQATRMSDAAVDAEVVRRGPSGIDPMPAIRALTIPALWLYGGRDRHIPARLSEKRLATLAAETGRDFTVRDFPDANHALVETTTGLTSEMLRSHTYAPGLFTVVGDWLRAHHLGR